MVGEILMLELLIETAEDTSSIISANNLKSILHQNL